jgi:sensor domain CHASE-containing protein/GAF domain-containing protein
MNLRIRTILAVAALILGVVAVFYVVTRMVVLNSFVTLEKRSAEISAQQLQIYMQKETNSLSRLTLNYAQENETYRYLAERHSEYLANTLNAAAFANYGIDNVAIYDFQGRIYYEATYNAQTNSVVSGAQSLVTYVRNTEANEVRNFITRPANANSSVSGLILLPEGPMLISAQPILSAGGTGVVTGTLVLGRYVDAQEMQNIADALRSPVSYALINNTTSLPDDFQEAYVAISAGKPSFTRTNQEATFVYVVLPDVLARPAVVMRVDISRDAYALALESQRSLVAVFLIGGLIAVIVISILVFLIAFQPLRHTQRTLQAIRQKKALNTRLPVLGNDELALLSDEINSLINDLEQASQDVLQGKNAQQRFQQMQSVRQVIEAISNMLDTEQIIRKVVAEIGDRFNYYYVGVFLVDEGHLNAVLRAGTGNVVAEGYQLTVGGSSTVGMAIARQQIQMAEIGSRKDQISFTRLPMARSEIAIPIRNHNDVLGAIAIQSTQADTFKNSEDQDLLQYLADFMGAMLVSTRLIDGLQKNYKNLEAQYQQFLMERWSEELRLKNDLSYTFQIRSSGRSKEQVHQLQAPVALNDVKIGWVELDTERANWSSEDRAMLDAILAQMAQALENARLLERSRRRATQERLVAEVTRAARASTDVDTILHNSTLELGRLLRASMVEIRIQPDITANKPAEAVLSPVAAEVRADAKPTQEQSGNADETQEVTA